MTSDLVLPHFVTAANEQQLQNNMAKVQFALGGTVKFYSIQEKQNGQWIAWYNKKPKGLGPKINGDKENGLSKK